MARVDSNQRKSMDALLNPAQDFTEKPKSPNHRQTQPIAINSTKQPISLDLMDIVFRVS